MSKITFIDGGIESIYRGSRKGKFNWDILTASKRYQDAVLEFLNNPTLEQLAHLMNTPNSLTGVYALDTQREYFFILNLLFAIQEDLKIIDKRGGS